ncbi:hypothetical protein GH714_029869 [Hevea brasiliensis]|uniref:Uncharacterized protein n=1 Tax=Hevea brasiliensis TaxID=3981 RepID=A0A6A6KV80_HEVBR|nr:hypothetical protein GH714_029751 [Hevea brasiliensis]KAF2292922.1 hypothetical protein GH714_029869 [Hevea brasiliensis]
MPGQCGSNKASPSPYNQNGSVDFPSFQSHANPSSIQRVSSAHQPSSKVSPSPYTPYYSSMDYFPHTQSTQVSTAQLRSFHDYGGDENVDTKASSYITCVRERFKVEKVDSEAWVGMLQF